VDIYFNEFSVVFSPFTSIKLACAKSYFLKPVVLPCLICIADGIVEEAWFDSVGLFDSECDDDYQSVLDGMIWRILNLIFDVLVTITFMHGI